MTFDLQINNSDLFDLNFVIKGKVISYTWKLNMWKEVKVLSTISVQNIRREQL